MTFPHAPATGTPAPSVSRLRRRLNFGWRGGRHTYDFEGQGRAAVRNLSSIFILVAILYTVLHLTHPASRQAIAVREFLQLSSTGLARITSVEDVDWYVGPEKARPLLTGLDLRNRQIVDLHSQIRETVTRLTGLSGLAVGEAAGKLMAQLEYGDDTAGSKPAVSSNELLVLGALLDRIAALVASVHAADAYNVAAIEEIDAAIVKANTLVLGLPVDDKRTALDELLKTITLDLRDYRNRADRKPCPPESAPGGGTPQQRLEAAAATAVARATETGALLENLRREASVLRDWLARRGDPLLQLDRFLVQLDAGATDATTVTLVVNLRQQVARLVALRIEQRAAVDALTPPVRLSIFWMTPRGIIAEILFWGMFGVLTNLLVNIAEATRRNEYRPSEWVVISSKMIYGPALSLVLCLSMLTGLVNLAGEGVRAWAMPLVSFLFGFNTRKTARLVDDLSQRIFKSTKEAIDRPEAMAAARAQLIASYTELVKPASLPELRDSAHRIAEDTVRNIIARNEARL